MTITNPGKPLWPEEGWAKRDLIDYYRRIAPVMLPYLVDRPQNLLRHIHGPSGPSFWQKNMEGAALPKWIPTVTVVSETDGSSNLHMLCQEEAALVYMANLGCIEINPWLSHRPSLTNPDYVAIDLDPQATGFEAAIETALAVRDVLASAELPSFLKTSGGKGLHIYIPTGARYAYAQVRMFAEIVAALAHSKLPKITSLERPPAKRVGKVYIDYLQNRQGQTLSSVYSIRPRASPTVSTPLTWHELEQGVRPADFNVRTIFPRLEQTGDLWAGIAGQAIDLEAALKHLR